MNFRVLTEDGAQLESATLNFYVETGATVAAIMRLLLNRRDLEIRLFAGQIQAGYVGDKDHACTSGVQGVEPEAWEWQKALQFLGELGRR